MKNNKIKLDYKWVIVALCFLMVFTCLGFCSSNKGLYLSAITDALDIKRSAFSIGDSCRFISTAIVNLFFGTLVNKFGTKKLIGAGFLSLIGACILYTIGTNIYYFYVGGCLLGIGISWTTTTMVGAVIGKWCKENKGTIMGAVLAANGLGGALAAQIVTPIIYEEGNAFGYRNAYTLVAIILLIVGTLILIFFKENPPGHDGTVVVHKKKSRGQSWVGMEYRTAVKKPYFYAALVCIFMTGMILQGINGVASAHMKDVGLSAEYIAMAASIHSLSLAAFKFLTGFMYDKFGLRITMTVCDIASIAVMVLLASITNSSWGMIFAMMYSIISSLSLPLETIMLPIFAGDLFGEKSFHKMLGLFVSVNTAGYAVGAPLTNWVFDAFGSYTPMFIVCAVLMAAVTIIFQFILTAAQKDRWEILAKEAA